MIEIPMWLIHGIGLLSLLIGILFYCDWVLSGCFTYGDYCDCKGIERGMAAIMLFVITLVALVMGMLWLFLFGVTFLAGVVSSNVVVVP